MTSYIERLHHFRQYHPYSKLQPQRPPRIKIKLKDRVDAVRENRFFMMRSEFDPSVPLGKRVIPIIERKLDDGQHKTLEIIDLALSKGELPDFLEKRYCQKIQGHGIFAKKFLPKGTLIGLYACNITEEPTPKGRYKYSYVDPFTLDAEKMGNYTRYLNSAFPEDEKNVDNYRVYLGGQQEMAFVTTKDVEAGQQLLIYYGDNYFPAHHIIPTNLNPDDL